MNGLRHAHFVAISCAFRDGLLAFTTIYPRLPARSWRASARLATPTQGTARIENNQAETPKPASTWTQAMRAWLSWREGCPFVPCILLGPKDHPSCATRSRSTPRRRENAPPRDRTGNRLNRTGRGLPCANCRPPLCSRFRLRYTVMLVIAAKRRTRFLLEAQSPRKFLKRLAIARGRVADGD